MKYLTALLLCILLSSFTLSGGAPVSDSERWLYAVESDIIRLHNEKRAELGLTKLVPDERLHLASRTRSSEMFRYDYFAHSRPNGDAWFTVLDEAGVSGYYASENIAKGSQQGGAAAAQDILCAQFWQSEWENSPPHREAIIDPGVSSIGVGFYYVETGGFVAVYGTVLFAAIM